MADISAILKNKGVSGVKKGTAAHYEVTMIHYSQIYPSKMQFYAQADIEEQADNIELAGGIMQPLVVRKKDADQYELLAGHRRLESIKLLVEERGCGKYAMVPCHIEQANDWRAEYLLITTNSYREKSGYEKMMEVQRLSEIIPHLSGNEQLKGRALRAQVAKELKTGETSIQNYNYIYSHLCPEGMEAFKNGVIKTSVANDLAHLEEEEQKELLKANVLTSASIAEYMERKACQSLTQTPEPECVLRKPTMEERTYLERYAKHFIRREKDWLLKDFDKRVMDVTNSPLEIYQRFGEHDDYFQIWEKEVGHIHFHENAISLFASRQLLGKFEWFYLAAAIQAMWNVVSLEDAQKESVSKFDTTKDKSHENSLPEYGKEDIAIDKTKESSPTYQAEAKDADVEPESDESCQTKGQEEPGENGLEHDSQEKLPTKKELQEILQELIDENKRTLKTMEDYWKSCMPKVLWKHQLIIRAAENYLELLSEDATE